MKKVLAIMLAALMIFSMAACGTKKEESGVKNPWVTYESLEQLNEKFGCKLARPGVMGVSDEAYTALETENEIIAQYNFSLGGYDYTLRYSPEFEKDISGLYIGKGTAFEGVSGEATVSSDEFKAARWMTVDGQYVLSVADKGKMDSAAFESAAEEIRSLTIPGLSAAEKQVIYDNLAGEYSDTFSGRAVLDITAIEGGVKALVSWGSSASENDTWEMTLTVGEDELFSYTDGKHIRHTWNEKGEEATEEIAKDQNGYFELNEKGDLLWTGAADEDCKECVFEK